MQRTTTTPRLRQSKTLGNWRSSHRSKIAPPCLVVTTALQLSCKILQLWARVSWCLSIQFFTGCWMNAARTGHQEKVSRVKALAEYNRPIFGHYLTSIYQETQGIWKINFLSSWQFWHDSLTSENLALAGEGCLFNGTKDGVINTWLARDTVP